MLTVDLHADQIQGFFDIPVDNVYSSPVLLGEAGGRSTPTSWWCRPTSVAWCARARWRSDSTTRTSPIIDKRRPRANVSEVMNIIGEVEGKTCVLVDDMVDTAGTLCHAAKALKDHGAKRVAAYITHPVLSGPAVDRIEESALDELVVTDTIPLRANAQACRKIRQLSVAGLLAETMRRIRDEESVSSSLLGLR